MDIKFWTPVLVGTIMAIGSVQAMADSNWSYDESSDTIIHNFDGQPVTQSSSHDDVTKDTGSWYYDESTDTIVHHVEVNRNQYSANSSSPEPAFDKQTGILELAFLDQ